MKSLLLPLAACAALAGCVGYGGGAYYGGGYSGYDAYGGSPGGYYAQPNIVYGATYYGAQPAHRHHEGRRGPGGDRDRDGIPNRADRDRDNDGVRNRDDRRPNDPRRN
ncbi:MAG: hypothetical protein EOO24_49070 [Comamonadaceae bacterium]|nr:MAG: hypothetical protein EOO24_49070 [Comamonadaceae bacterium]